MRWFLVSEAPGETITDELPLVSKQVSLQTHAAPGGGLPGGLPGLLGALGGAARQEAGAVLAAKLLNTEQELDSALELLRSYTTQTTAARLTAAPR